MSKLRHKNRSCNRIAGSGTVFLFIDSYIKAIRDIKITGQVTGYIHFFFLNQMRHPTTIKMHTSITSG